MVRFEARHRRGKDDGADFGDFVCEVLSIGREFGSPVRRDSGSSDGSIDLFSELEGVVIECKHINSAGSAGRKRIAQEWNEVRDKLDRALLSVAGVAAPTRTPYRPWADAERPIRRYVFAVSTHLTNLDHRRELLGLIQSFLRDQIGRRGGYEHLRNVSVDILDWSDFETRLSRREFKALVFRWLEQWPAGFSDLDMQSATGFRSFQGDRLPYLARDSWTPPTTLKHSWTEQSLIDDLVLASQGINPVVVLTGPGGVGKTRLGLELARRIHRDHRWWAVRCDGRNANSEGLRKLLMHSPESQSIVLFADYLEIWPAFEAFVNDIVNLNETSGHIIRVIGTCRASYRERLPTSVRQVAVGAATSLENAYSHAVCEHILHGIGSAETTELAERCRYNPALAAFLLLLHHDAPDSFAEEVSSLRKCVDFTDWVLRRLRSAGLKLEPVATILAACPLRVDTFDSLASGVASEAGLLADVLVADHWIERQEPPPNTEIPPIWATFHDVFADSILANYLRSAPDLNDSIDRLLERGASHGAFDQILTSLERLRDSLTVSEVIWLSRLKEVERRKPGILASYANALLSNALLSPVDRLTLIDTYPSLQVAIAQNRDCDVGVALNAVGLARVRLDESIGRAFESIFLPLLDIAARSPRGNLCLRLAFTACPDRYRSDALASCSLYPRSLPTHFVLRVWLDDVAAKLAANEISAVSHLETIDGAVTEWLRANSNRWQASFVLAPWLQAAAGIKGDRAIKMIALAQSCMEMWLAVEGHATHEDAHHLYCAWLEAAAASRGERAIEMIAWLRPRIEAWLSIDRYAKHDSAYHLYSAWLEAAAAIRVERASEMAALIQPRLEAWLAVDGHAANLSARRLYETWLNVAAAIRGEVAARMVNVIELHVAAWVNTHATHELAKYLYCSWLEAARGPCQRRFYAETLAAILANAEEEDSDYLLESWLDQRLEFEPVRAACFTALHRLRHSPEGTYILKHIVRQRGLPDEVVCDAVDWCKGHPAHPDAINRIGPLVTARTSNVVGIRRLTLVVTRVLHLADFGTIVSDSTKVAATRGSLGSLFAVGKYYPRAGRVASICLVAALRDGRLFDMPTMGRDGPRGLLFDQKTALVFGLLGVMKQGKLDPLRDAGDHIALTRFCDWVGQWKRTNEELDQLRSIVQQLTSGFGLPSLWLRMMGSRILPQPSATAGR
jgi:hypothetical protein